MSGTIDPGASIPERLAALLETLEGAAEIIQGVRNDPILAQLIGAFAAMPLADRAVLVGAIEREVQARKLSCATSDVTGQSMHPNPNARLYIRQFDNPHLRSVLERDEMMFATLQALRVTPILTVPEIHAEWLDATREAIGHLDVPTRRIVQTLMREVLALVDTSIDEAPPESDPDEGSERATSGR